MTEIEVQWVYDKSLTTWNVVLAFHDCTYMLPSVLNVTTAIIINLL